MIEQAADIRMRAERTAGQLLAEMAEKGERDSGHGDRESGSQDVTPKLADLGVSKMQSHRWQKLGGLDGDAFEAREAAAESRRDSRALRIAHHTTDKARPTAQTPIFGCRFHAQTVATAHRAAKETGAETREILQKKFAAHAARRRIARLGDT
jgi:hypothetical protein